jgi:hypothetical protein
MFTGTRPTKRIYLVNRDFQGRYVRIALIVGGCSTALTLVLVLYPLFYLDILRWPNFVPPPFIAAMVVAAVINFIVVGWMSIMVTHRVAGPMYSLVRHFRLLQEGRIPPPLRVRDSDELKFVVRNFNEAVTALAVRAKKERGYTDGVLSALLRAHGSADASTPTGEAMGMARDLRAELDLRLELLDREEAGAPPMPEAKAP